MKKTGMMILSSLKRCKIGHNFHAGMDCKTWVDGLAIPAE